MSMKHVEESGEKENVEVEESGEEEVEVEVEVEESGEEEEEEVFMKEIDGKSYYVDTKGMIYAVTEDEEVGDEVGYYEDGEPGFYE